MEVSDIAAEPVELGAELRLRVSPAGVLARGTIERTTREGLTATATVRRDRRTGVQGNRTPGGMPDIAGLAWRMPAMLRIAMPWNVLLPWANGSRCLDAGDNVGRCKGYGLEAVAIRSRQTFCAPHSTVSPKTYPPPCPRKRSRISVTTHR